MSDVRSAAGSAALADAYDRVRYPSNVFEHTHPERMATIAHLHGLSTPAIETARVLEIGGGDGLNLLAMASTLPNASFLSVDIAREPVRSGAALAAAANLANVRVEVADVLDLADHLDEGFDYIIAHGVYAWVPDFVRPAILRTMGRALSPDGVAFVSYNTDPGGRIRGIMRDMALASVPEGASHEERLAIGLGILKDFAESQPDDSPLMRGLREQAALLVRRPAEEVAHDELGMFYAPQAFAEVAQAAAGCGLAYLNDAERKQRDEGFSAPTQGSQAALIRHLEALDYRQLRFFRHSLFVRDGRPIDRHFNQDRLAPLWFSFGARRTGSRQFDLNGTVFEIGDDHVCDVLEQAAAIHPRRMQIGPLNLGTERTDVLLRLFDNRVCKLHFQQMPGVLDSDRPRASPLALAQLARGDERIARLDHIPTALHADVRGILALLDGRRDLAELAERWSHVPAAAELSLPDAIRMLGRQALLYA